MTKRRSPGTKSRATRSTATVDATSIPTNPAEDGYLPDPEARAVKQALEVLREHGYGIAMRCLDCQHPITSAASLARMRGPRCAAKAVAE